MKWRVNEGISGNVGLYRGLLLFLKTLIITIFILYSSIHHAFSQRYSSKYYTEADGLSSSTVYDVIQDTSGILWFATRAGISAYNGLEFKNYSITEGINSRGFSFFDIDRNGTLWAFPKLGNGAAFYFEKGKWQYYTHSNDGNSPVNNYTGFKVLNIGKQQIIAVGTSSEGLYAYSKGIWLNYDITNDPLSNSVNGIEQYAGYLYIAHEKGISIYNGQEILTPEAINSAIQSREVLALYNEKSANKEVLWILGNTWLGKLTDGKYEQVGTFSDLSASSHLKDYFISPSGNDELYFGNPTAAFLLLKKNKVVIPFDQQNGLIANGATGIYFDREQNCWITGYRGITKISSRRLVGYSAENGLFENEVTSAIEIKKGVYVFGHYGALSILENGNFSKILLSSSEEERKQKMRILDMALDKEGNLWLAVASKGLAWMDKSRKIHWFPLNTADKSFISSVAVGQNGHIYVASNREVLDIYKSDK